MGFDLLLAMWIAYYLTRNTVQDLAWKARGEDPPSFRREQERLANRRARRPVTDRREGRRFFANAWHDAWESAGERRARGYAQRAERRRERWEHDDDVADAERQAHDRNRELDAAEDQAHERNARIDSCEQCDQPVIGSLLRPRHRPDGQFVLACPPCADQLDRATAAGRPIPAEEWFGELPDERPGQRPGERPGEQPARPERTDSAGRARPVPGQPEQPQPAPIGDGEHHADQPRPGAGQARTPGTDGRPAGGDTAADSAAEHEDPNELREEDFYELATPEGDQPIDSIDQSIDQHSAAGAAEPSGERSEDRAGEGPDAQVIHLPVWQAADPVQHPTQHDPSQHDPTQQEENAMSETTSLNSALAYTTQMSGNAGQAAISVETSIASLMAGGVTGPAISALQAAQEAMNTAAAQFQAAHAALQRHVQVQEAYAANDDAGTREFVKAD